MYKQAISSKLLINDADDNDGNIYDEPTKHHIMIQGTENKSNNDRNLKHMLQFMKIFNRMTHRGMGGIEIFNVDT